MCGVIVQRVHSGLLAVQEHSLCHDGACGPTPTRPARNTAGSRGCQQAGRAAGTQLAVGAAASGCGNCWSCYHAHGCPPLLLLSASLVMQLNPTRHTAAAVPGVTTCLLVRMMPRALSTMKPDA